MCAVECLSPLARASMLASTISAEQPILAENPRNLTPQSFLGRGLSLHIHPSAPLPGSGSPDTGRLKI